MKIKTLDDNNFNKMMASLKSNRYKCNCGNERLISKNEDKAICLYCGNYVFKNKKDEFIYRLKENKRRIENV